MGDFERQSIPQPVLEPMPHLFGPRMALGFSAQFLFVGLYLPYFPLWLEAKGLGPFEISIVLSLPLIIRVMTSGQVMVFADQQRDRSNLLSALFVASAVAVLFYLWTERFWTIFTVTLFFNFFFNPILPLLDAITLAGNRRFGADYGKIRVWGSLVFILANLGGGALLLGYEPDAVLLAIIAGVVLGAFSSFLLPRIGRRPSWLSREQKKVTRRELLSDRTFITVLTASGLAQASHALLYGFGSIYWQMIGFSGLTIGWLWAIGVIAEVMLFQYSGTVLQTVTPAMLIGIGSLGGMLRWLAFPFAETETVFLLLQILHGLSFGAVHIGTMHFIAETVPEDHLGAAQGAGYVLGGVAMAVAVFASGPIYSAWGVYGYWVMAAICLIALSLILFTELRP